jgi:hypothetical protein
MQATHHFHELPRLPRRPGACEASYRGHAIIRTVAWWIATSLSCHGSTEPLPPLVSGAVR